MESLRSEVGKRSNVENLYIEKGMSRFKSHDCFAGLKYCRIAKSVVTCRQHAYFLRLESATYLCLGEVRVSEGSSYRESTVR